MNQAPTTLIIKDFINQTPTILFIKGMINKAPTILFNKDLTYQILIFYPPGLGELNPYILVFVNIEG